MATKKQQERPVIVTTEHRGDVYGNGYGNGYG